MSLFADVDTAARIERAECSLIEDGASAITRLHPDSTVFVRSIAGGIAAHTADGSALNKLAGLGFKGVPEKRELAVIEDEFKRRNSTLTIELSTLGDPAVATMLTRRGYAVVGFEAVLGRRIEPHDAPPSPEGITIQVDESDDPSTWIDMVATGFGAPDVEGVPSHESFPRDLMEAGLRDSAGIRGFVRYLAMRDGQPAGGASLRVAGGIAQLCGSATIPEHRRRGIQTAFLARRLADAARAGCDLAVITTQPGSKSMENAQRRGFDLLYVRSILQGG